MHYYPEDQGRENIEKIRQRHICAVCGRQLSIYLGAGGKSYIACSGQVHNGIAREYNHPVEDYQQIKRREIELDEQYGLGKATALAKYQGASVITREIASEIVGTLWGNAPEIEKMKAIILCSMYNLNPLAKHIHLVKYNRWNKEKTEVIGADWTLIQGIQATRLLARRRHSFTYLDMSPRIATSPEIKTILGDTAKPDHIYGYCHIRDLVTGAEAWGLVGISTKDKIKGEDKGNSHLNLACIRAERQAFERQYPAEMPPGMDVVDEDFIELPNVGLVDNKTGEIIESKLQPPPEATSGKKRGVKDEIGISSSSDTEQASIIDMDWLTESLRILRGRFLATWEDANVLSYLKTTYKIEAGAGPVLDAVAKLDRNQATHFVNKVQSALDAN